MGEMPDWLQWDEAQKVLTVDGFRISRELLTQITTSPCGVRYRIISRDDGTITVGYERDPIEAAAQEMLAALRECLPRFEATIFELKGLMSDDDKQNAECNDADQEAIERGRAAIARATNA